jgi:hypothetical protein
MRLVRTLFQYTHRYLGIPLSFMFVVWFVSAFFMIYTGGMPRITPDQRSDGMQAIDFSRVRLSLAEASDLSGFTNEFSPPAASLRTILDRPVYVLGEAGYNPVFVAADNGELLEQLTPDQGLQLASAFLAIPAEQFSFVGVLDEPDQWTLTSLRELPLYRYSVDDSLGTEVYVSPREMQVSVYTTRQSRVLAWLGTIPHWLYFSGLRNNQPLWYDLVVYAAYAGCVVALMGLVLAVLQWRKVKPFSLSRAIPYRGLHRWHYIVGAVFGVFSLTWVFSGLVSMEPWWWTNASGLRVSPAALQDELQVERFPAPAQLDWSALPSGAIKQAEFRMIMGAPYVVATWSVPTDSTSSKRDRLHQPYNINGQSAAASAVIDVSSGKLQSGFAQDALVARLTEAVPGSAVTAAELLQSYDDYYYSRQGQLALPVLRVKFDDPARSWIYVDPVRGELLSIIHKYSRVERWLYSGLHSLDFAFWYHKRPLWDLVVILFLCGGLATSALGLYMGLRRLVRDLKQLVQKVKSTPLKEDAEHAAH